MWKWKSNDTGDEPFTQLSRQHWEEFGLWSTNRDYKLRPGTPPLDTTTPPLPLFVPPVQFPHRLFFSLLVLRLGCGWSLTNRNNRIPLLRVPPNRQPRVPKPSLASLPIHHRRNAFPARLLVYSRCVDPGGMVPE